MDSKVIAITLYRRPVYTAQLFSALRDCYGIEDYTVVISCDAANEHEAACNEVYRQALKFAEGNDKISVYHHNPRLGVDLNKLWLFPKAFKHGEYVVFLEDDTIPAPDALRFFESMDMKYREDESVVSISGYNRYLEQATHDRVLLEESYVLDQGGQFCPWGFGIWRDRYEQIVGMDGAKYLEATGAQANGLFDHNMCRWMRENPGHRTIYPVLPRIQSIGGEMGEHTPSAAWHQENEYNPFGSWSQPMGDYEAHPNAWGLKEQ